MGYLLVDLNVDGEADRRQIRNKQPIDTMCVINDQNIKRTVYYMDNSSQNTTLNELMKPLPRGSFTLMSSNENSIVFL